MDLQLFGYKIGKEKKQVERQQERVPSPITPSDQDAALTISDTLGDGAFHSISLDMDGAVRNEVQLITKYRQMAQQPEAERAIDDIVNEAVVIEDETAPVSINLDNIDQSEKVKKKINEEFENILRMLDFNNQGYDIFRNWYIDGRLYYHKMIDVKNPRQGIQELRFIDPRKIKKVREQIKKNRTNIAQQGQHGTSDFNKQYNEYFLYNERGIHNAQEGIKIAKDSVTFVHSGIMNENNSTILSHLHKALKPWNQLRWMEDSLVIYRISRAPERRIFYIDVGNLPKNKAEQYLKDMMTKHKNKLTYDASSGEVKDERRFMTMLEDFWLPRREGGRGTQIETLPGGENLGQIEDVQFFKEKFYRSLNIPISRLESDTGFNLGRGSEISRDELKFSKFISRLRSRFSGLFDDLLRTQLLLKGITDHAGWEQLKEGIFYDFNRDNYFSELKNQEIMRERFNLLDQIDSYVGRYVSVEWIRKNVLQQTETEIEEIEKQIKDEAQEPDADSDGESDEATDTNFGAFKGRPDVKDDAAKDKDDDDNDEEDDNTPGEGDKAEKSEPKGKDAEPKANTKPSDSGEKKDNKKEE